MGLAVRELGETDVAAVQGLLEAVPDYARRVTGEPPGPADAVAALAQAPDGFDRAGKRAIGAWDGAELVGFADVLMGWPDEATAFIGLLIVRGDRQGQGLGRRLHDAVVERAYQACGPDGRLRLAIVDTNKDAAEPFWRALGYVPTGEVRPYRHGDLISRAALWQRTIGKD